MFLAHFRTGIAFSPDGRLWGADEADEGSAGAGEVVGNAEAVQDAVQAVGELLIQRVVQVAATTAVWGIHGLAASVRHSGGGQLDDGRRWS
jgi:hypothetical protein